MIKKRVIAAVPDLHSRKPCLKELIEPFMPDAKDYSALEIFGRYAVKGWSVWGDEALKFNADMYWVEHEDEEMDEDGYSHENMVDSVEETVDHVIS